MYFPLGGGTLKGISKPGTIVWSRVFIMKDALHADLGLGTVVALPQEEVEKRWKETTSQWPIMSKPQPQYFLKTFRCGSSRSVQRSIDGSPQSQSCSSCLWRFCRVCIEGYARQGCYVPRNGHEGSHLRNTW